MRALKIYETLEFKQGGDPYQKLGVGAAVVKKRIAKDISIRDLNIFYEMWQNKEIEEIEEFYGEVSQKHLEAYNILKKDIDFANYAIFDWSEKKEMIKYVNNNPHNQYVYDIGSNSEWLIIFSNIDFPSIATHRRDQYIQ